MENGQIECVTKHLPYLIENTSFDEKMISLLLSKKVISSAEANVALQGTSSKIEVASHMYAILQTRLNAYEVLRDCLRETCQTGALAKLSSPFERIKSISWNKNNILGTGSNGTKVYEGECQKRKVAVKIVNFETVDSRRAIKEVELLSKLEFHENVVQCHGYEKTQFFIYIALELCDVTLDKWVKSKTLTIEYIEVLRQATKGLEYLHGNQIVHRDIKPKNILLVHTGEKRVKVKIADLGLSHRIQEESSTSTLTIGTREWTAPEILNFAYNGDKAVLKMSYKSDIFSLGCVFFFVLTHGLHPFGSRPFIEGNIIKGKYELCNIIEHQVIYLHSSIHLIKSMISNNEKFRPHCKTILKHNLFWSSAQWLGFLAAICDLITADSSHCIALLNAISMKPFTNQQTWRALICEAVKDYLESSRSFSDDLVGLIQAINYIKKRFDDLPEPVKARFGTMPNGFVQYWLEKFPGLFQSVYAALQKIKTSSLMESYYCEKHIYQNSNFRRMPSTNMEHQRTTRRQSYWLSTFKMAGVLAILSVVLSYFLGTKVFNSVSNLNTNLIDEPIENEICEPSTNQYAMKVRSNLDNLFRENMFGQHLAHSILVREIYNHLKNPNPSKPLTLSFHGSPGLGKRLASVLVMRALYTKGENSKFVKVFSALRDFKEPEFLFEYKRNITLSISDTISKCPQSLFVFDGVDILPVGLLDALIPFTSHPESFKNGNDYNYPIYIFIGDSMDTLINNLTLENLKANNRRSNIKQEQFESFLSNEAFRISGGWYKTGLEERIMVDIFVPFLPMEKRHVLECFRRLARSQKGFIFSEDEFEDMASSLEYWPSNTANQFSKMGCENVRAALNARTTEKEFWLNKQM